ncbi:hypothetical protein AJ79_00914 [Helicocarpus griseus UAMH5409]|uniref:Nuclear transport factor 2 n=1 Tax=Helicocarpus griseus UAMH5409 TaxID=1447875 RepID=A0A2B7Y9Q7_9EURO|nr:hypothetical protein AJ79_00914 [Helicocarpus griseus UAMH5409]
MADFQTVADEFVKLYYDTFDHDRKDLAPLYRPTSMLTFETNRVQGTEAIVKQLVDLPFQKVEHKRSTVDAQPTEEGGVVVLVTGALMVDDEKNPMNYTQAFHLRRDAVGFYVYNDIFKLIYPM